MSRTRTIDIDYDDLPQLRQRELGSFRKQDSDPDRGQRRDRDEEYEYRRRRYVVEDDLPRMRRPDYDRQEEQQLVPYNKNRNTDVVAYDRRQAQSDYDRTRGDYDRKRDYDEGRSRRSYDDGRSRRDYSERDSSRSRRDRRKNRRRDDYDDDRSGDDANSADEGLMFYSGKRRGDGNFFEKNFDSSYEGITAAIAGGLIGGMTARRFGGEENNKAKVLAGTAIGAAALNAGENWYRIFTEERAERKAERRERRRNDRRD
ncbi:hypothetical protein MBLNU457_2188t1 [Dothideomycetes sp. NU457]